MADFAKEGGHWYTLTGEPAYTIAGANGAERAVTLRDARKLNLVPSVTTIMRCAAAPGLERWKSEQLLLAALTLPRRPHEPEWQWLDRVRVDAGEQGRKAAERGTLIHGAIECHFRQEPVDTVYHAHVAGTRAEIDRVCGEQQWLPERSFAHPMGYGGKCDLHSFEWVLDHKSKEFDAENPPGLFDEHPMQLAAYRRGLRAPGARCGIVFVSASVPGLAVLREVAEADLTRGIRMFDALLDYWQHKTNHRPTVKPMEVAA